jgi:hypothetical protein
MTAQTAQELRVKNTVFLAEARRAAALDSNRWSYLASIADDFDRATADDRQAAVDSVNAACSVVTQSASDAGLTLARTACEEWRAITSNPYAAFAASKRATINAASRVAAGTDPRWIDLRDGLERWQRVGYLDVAAGFVERECAKAVPTH